MDEDRQQRDKASKPSCVFSSAWTEKDSASVLSQFKISTALCFNESVSSSTSSEYGSCARKNFMGEQLEQPLRFLPTGALVLRTLHALPL